MYAAGHPPLPSIEVETFAEHMPPHWTSMDKKKNLPDKEKIYAALGYKAAEMHGAKSVLVGSVVTLAPRGGRSSRTSRRRMAIPPPTLLNSIVRPAITICADPGPGATAEEWPAWAAPVAHLGDRAGRSRHRPSDRQGTTRSRNSCEEDLATSDEFEFRLHSGPVRQSSGGCTARDKFVQFLGKLAKQLDQDAIYTEKASNEPAQEACVSGPARIKAATGDGLRLRVGTSNCLGVCHDLR